jgi:hypothetical protein
MENCNLWCWCFEKSQRESQRQCYIIGVECFTFSIDDNRFIQSNQVMKRKNKNTKEFFILLTYGGTMAFGIWLGLNVAVKLLG